MNELKNDHNIPVIVASLRNHFKSGVTQSIDYRKKQLSGIESFLRECESQIEKALFTDLGKPAAETLAAEICSVMTELKYTQDNLAKWMKPKRVATTLIAQPGSSKIYPEPLGVVLIIAPWNYPINLTLVPLIGALSAGNCVVLKPSEVAPATSQLLARELPKYIDPACLSIVEGAVAETTALLAERFDHILYTGNGSVGRIVMAAAAKNLTPVTLELGGKSPCLVDKDTNLNVAAKRIIWGKFSNAGQTCTAPDYLLVHEAVESELLDKMKQAVEKFYGNDPKSSRDYGRVINVHHYQRLMKLLANSGEIVIGGTGDEQERYIAPTILRNVSPDSPVMSDEIFGPLLPVIKVKNMQEAIDFVNARPKPLSLYLFSSNRSTCDNVIKSTSSGTVCLNYPLLQVIVPALPFGGVGASGMGAYHGKASFNTFSHYKSVLSKPTWIDPSILYPPYTKHFTRLIHWLMR